MRTVRRPTSGGIGDGRAVYFLWGLREEVAVDLAMRTEELASLEDDVEVLTAHGYTVVVDLCPERRALREALYARDPELEGFETAAVYWSSHGALDGSLQLATGQWVSPSDIDPSGVTRGLSWVVFSSCHTGKHRRIWQQQLGEHVKIVAWNRALWQREAIAFNTPDAETGWGLDDLIREVLLPGGGGLGAVPDPPEDWTIEGFDPGPMEFVQDPAEDAHWAEVFRLLEPHLVRSIEEQTGFSSRQLVWRLGWSLAEAVVIHLIPGREAKAQSLFEAAQLGAGFLLASVPPLFEVTGERERDLPAAVRYLCQTVLCGALGRAIRRFGADHEALLESSLLLLFLSLEEEARVLVQRRLAASGQAAGLSPSLWADVLSRTGMELFGAHEEILRALGAERRPSSVTRSMAWSLGRQTAAAAALAEGDPRQAEEILESCAQVAVQLGLGGLGPGLEASLGEAFGPDHASLFQLATRLVDLYGDYDPMNPERAYRLVKRLKRAGKAAGLPRSLWKKLSRLKQGVASRSEAARKIQAVLEAVEQHLLAAQAPPSS